jgi:predicted flap endonuclease-1-like 5' DNA nuclease
MGNVSQDMSRLRDEISQLRTERQAFISNLQAEWKNKGPAFVQALQSHVRDLQVKARADQTRLRQEFQSAVTASAEQRRQFISSLHKDSKQRVQRHRSELAQSKAETEALLQATVHSVKSDVQVLKDEVKDFLHQVHAFRSQTRTQFHRELEDVRTRLREFNRSLSEDTAKMMSGFAQDLQAQAQASQDVRGQFVDHLQGSLTEMRRQMESLRASFVHDLHAASQAWKGEKREDAASAAPEPGLAESGQTVPQAEEPAHESMGFEQPQEPEQKEAQAASSEFSPKQKGDDLTRIDGIGPGRKKQLNDVGIWAFSHLASMTADQLQQVVGEHTSTKVLERWIDQAKGLCT